MFENSNYCLQTPGPSYPRCGKISCDTVEPALEKERGFEVWVSNTITLYYIGYVMNKVENYDRTRSPPPHRKQSAS